MTNKDLLRTLRSITLSLESKERMRADLSAYADLHAIPANLPALSRLSPLSHFMLRTKSLYAGALALVLVIAGGTQASFAAEDAKPGDILYPVKVALAEPITLALAITPEQKAELAARYASRRVDEAAALSSQGKLDAKTADDLAVRFDSHVDALAKETEALEARGEISVSLAVRTDLEQKLTERAEEFVLADVAAQANTMALMATAEEAPADRFTARVFEKSKTLATTRERLESALALDIEAEKEGVNFAALRDVDASVQLVQLTLGKVTASVPVSSTTASSTATSTNATSTPQASPASKFFAPFLKR